MPLLQLYNKPLRGVWQITESSDEMLALLERKKLYLPFLQKVTSEKRRQEWLATRLLLKEMIGEEVEIFYDHNGAPFLTESVFQLSVSHTSGFVAVLLHEQPFAGIDIETYSDRALRLKERFLSVEEIKMLNPVYQSNHVLLCWSAKEVLFKMIRQVEVDFREHLHISAFPLQTEGHITVTETRTGEKESFLLHYQTCVSFVWVWNE